MDGYLQDLGDGEYYEETGNCPHCDGDGVLPDPNGGFGVVCLACGGSGVDRAAPTENAEEAPRLRDFL